MLNFSRTFKNDLSLEINTLAYSKSELREDGYIVLTFILDPHVSFC